MSQEWNPINFEVMAYKSTGTYIIKIGDEVSQLLDDHIVMTQSMSFSPYKKPFEERITKWESQLRTTQVRFFLSFFTNAFFSVSSGAEDAYQVYARGSVLGKATKRDP